MAHNQVVSQLRLNHQLHVQTSLERVAKFKLAISEVKIVNLIENFERLVLSDLYACLIPQKTVSSVSPQTPGWCFFGTTLTLRQKSHHVFIVIHYFVRVTLILYGWSWLSTTFIYRLFCQDQGFH